MSTTTRVNFHCHSNLSDGYLSPEAVAEQLAAAGVQYAALTDHDTIEGLARFKQTLAQFNVGCIAGLEIFTALDGREVHLQAYGFDPAAPSIQRLLAASPHNQGRPAALVDSLKDSWARMRRKEATEGPASPADALPSAAAAIAAVHEAGGRVFLAHPLSLTEDLAVLDTIVGELRTQGLDGIETLYAPYPTASRNLLCHMAEKHNLLIVAGTDFHGPTTPMLSLAAIEMPTAQWKAFRKAVAGSRRLAAKPAHPVESAPTRAPRHWARFFAQIVLPTLLAICLFVTAVFVFIVPAMRETLLDRKRELIRELTQSAWSILAEYEKEVEAGLLTRDEAQRLAVSRIEFLRYGKEGKDYFWITDMHPRMVMHPYRPDLNGQDLSKYVDPRGNRIFVEFVNVVKSRQAGYVDYVWQWKDQPDRLAPKESYVKGFDPWGWIIGTGMYLEDVQAEIGRLLERLIWVCIVIIVLLALLLLYGVRQSMKIEQARSRNEQALRESHAKYRALVEVATEGTMMFVEGRCTYFNPTMLDMLGFDAEEFLLLDLQDLLADAGSADPESPIAALLAGQPTPAAFETRLRKKDGELLDVMAAATPITLAGKTGFILVARDASRQARVEGELLGGGHQYQPLAEQGGLGIFRVSVGRRLRLVRANAPARRLFGLGPDADLAGTDLADLLDARERTALGQTMDACGMVSGRVIQLRSRTGEVLSVSVSLVAVSDDTGTQKCWDGMLQDITQQRKLEIQRDTLISELQTSLLFLNEPIHNAQYQPPRCAMDTPIGRAAEHMTRQGSSALFVTAATGGVIGLITDRDFRERVAAQRVDLSRPVVEIMSAPLVTIPDTAQVYEAILLMQTQGKRHLAVKNAAGDVTGLVTNIALVHFDQYSSIVMTREIAEADSIEALATLYERLPRLVGALVDSGAKPRNVTRVISATLDAVANRLIALATAKLGPPPVPFAFVALGSEGREEKTLVSDQDNAILYADPPAEQAAPVAQYFLALGEAVCDGLAAIGCRFCKGGIMAKTPDWCQSLSRWQEYFGRWIATAQPQDFLEINMFFDLRAMHGDERLVAQLRQHIGKRLKATVPFFVNYAQNALLYKPPVGYFGGLVADALGSQPRSLNLKDALRPIIGFARLYALQQGLSATNTLDRLQQLAERNPGKRAVCEEAAAAYNCVMDLRLKQQVAAVRTGGAAGNDIDPKTLTLIETSMLRQALVQVTHTQKQIQADFIGTPPTL